MISDALWTDFDNDDWIDIIVVGEFMPIKFFKNDSGNLKEVTATTGLTGTNGWWNGIASGDFDNDGDIDYVAGNLGLNGPYKASVKEPVCVYAADYDHNGKLDPIMCHFIDGKEYMVHSRNDVIKQMTPMRGRFRSYDSYASVTIQEAIKKDGLTWTHASDLKFWSNEAAALYEVQSIPANFLIDPDGNIIAQDLHGEEIAETLRRIIK